MRQIILFLLFQLLLAFKAVSQPTITLTKTLGGGSVEIIRDLLTDNEGHIIALCRADSIDGDVNCTLHGKNDVWLVKMDAAGTILKQRCYGGSEDEDPYQIMKTNDGGLLFTSQTFSDDGDVSGNHGSEEVWVVKLDSSWNIEWQRCIGGTSGDQVHNSIELQNGQYAINCETLSSNGDFQIHYGGYLSEDAWIVLLNTDGSLDTAFIYGGSGDDQISEIIELPDHDWQVFGSTISTDFDLAGTTSYGYRDGWIFKTDSSGIIKWSKRYGSDAPDFLETAKMISADYFLTAGSTSGFSTNHGSADVWVMKIDSAGNVMANYTYGGSNGDVATYRVRFEFTNNSYLSLGAYSYSNDGQVGLNYGYSDFWSLKLDINGVLLSSVAAGGSDYDDTYCNVAVNYSDFSLGGITLSNDFDIHDYKGNGDGWLVLISDYNTVYTFPETSKAFIEVFPNPATSDITICMSKLESTRLCFEMFSSDGKMVFRENVSGCYSILVQNLATGIYQYILHDENRPISSGKLIIQ